jgi:UDP-N-acetylglucosamine:LPS N-acetylglucosamine transferase
LALEITTLFGDPVQLARMAEAANGAGTTAAADRLADLVLKVARN